MKPRRHSRRVAVALRPRRVAALAALFLLLTSLPFGAQAASAEPSGDLPYAMVGASAAYVDGYAYVLGGRTETGQYSEQIHRYDVATSTVTSLSAKLPQVVGSQTGGRQSGVALALDGKVYYFGGAAIVEADINGDAKPEQVPRAIPDVVEFTPGGNARATLDRLPAGAWGMSGAVYNGKGYLFGGFSFDVTNPSEITRRDWILVFDPTRAEGQRIRLLDATLPYRVQDSAAAAVGNRIYVLGGLADHDPATNPCPSTRYYDSETQQYEDGTPRVCTTDAIVSFDPGAEITRDYDQRLPQQLQFIHAVSYRGKAYVAGGRLSDGAASSSILEFSPSASPPIRPLAPAMPTGVFGAPVVVDASGTLVVFGGRLGGITELTDDIVRIQPGPTRPLPPRLLTTTPIAGGVRLEWSEPVYDGDSPVTGYRVRRATPGAEPERLADVSALAYEDKTARPGTEYVYTVAAVNAVGESPNATTSRATEATPPGPVVDLQAYGGNAEVLLRWSPPVDTGGANVSGYRVHRDGALLTSLPPSAREHRDRAVSNDATYVYVVRAYNVKGDGAASPALTASPAPVPSAPADLRASREADKVELLWSAPPEPVDGYVVYRGEAPGRLASIATVTSLGYFDAVALRGKTYYYAVAAVNPVGESPPSELASISLVRTPGPPQSVFATPQEGAIRLTWQPPADTGDAPIDALRYYVTRKDPGASAPRILDTGGDLAVTFYTDARVQPGLVYEYTVTTVNGQDSTSPPSAPVQGSAKALVNRVPTAMLTVEQPHVDPGVPVRMDASSSFDTDGRIVNYVFDFDDGSPVQNTTSPLAERTYAKQGHRSIKLWVIDDRGAMSPVASRTVLVGVADQLPDPGTDTGTGSGTNTTKDARPGSTPGKIPGPGLLLVAVALIAAAAARHRIHRGR